MLNAECGMWKAILHSAFLIPHSILYCCARKLQVTVHLAEEALEHRAGPYLDDGAHTRGQDVVHGLGPKHRRGQLGDEVLLDNLGVVD